MATEDSRGRSGLGPLGRLTRLCVGVLALYFALFARDPDWVDALLGLVGLPALLVTGVWLWTRRRSQPIQATGPVGHAVNVAIAIALFALPATAGAALFFYGGSLLLAAARRNRACEVTAVSNAVLGRCDEVGCPVFLPIDALEERWRIGPAGIGAFFACCAAMPLVISGAIAGWLPLICLGAGLVALIATGALAGGALRRT